MITITPSLATLLALFLFFQAGPARAGNIEIEIFYLPHRPAMVVVGKVEQVVAEFKNVTVKKYSFEERDTEKMLKKYKITDHMPVAVFINGRDSFTVNGHPLRLRNFPKGDAFVPMFAGEWDYTDLRVILAELSGGGKE
ncbi:MAG: hypothetical protein ACOY4H_14535 [Thermodesulfobacteriota bacterium]